MRCYNPIKIKEDVFIKRGRVMSYEPKYRTVPCGKCLACLGQKSSELAMRCEHENMFYNYGLNSCFVTLTYNKDNLPGDYSLHLEDVQKFFKRLRITLSRKYKDYKDIKYLLVGEYGTKRGRPHYHAIIFGLPNCDKVRKLLSDSWKLGFVHVGSSTPESIKYCVKYMSKSEAMYLNRKLYREKTGRERPFRTMSKGLGKKWLLKYYKHVISNNYRISYNGNFYSVPRSYIRWMYKLNLNPNISDDLKLLSRKKFINDLERLYKRYNVSEEKLLEYQQLPDDFKYSLEHYDVFYKLWLKEQSDMELSYRKKRELYLDKIRIKKKYLPEEIA